eukprot:3234337-Prymnesium_polylepis.1
MAYGLWCAVRRYSDATRSCGASGTRYVTMRGRTGSRLFAVRVALWPMVRHKAVLERYAAL